MQGMWLTYVRGAWLIYVRDAWLIYVRDAWLIYVWRRIIGQLRGNKKYRLAKKLGSGSSEYMANICTGCMADGVYG